MTCTQIKMRKCKTLVQASINLHQVWIKTCFESGGAFWVAIADVNLYPKLFWLHVVGDVTEMMITWVTFAANVSSIVEYGLKDEALAMTASGSATTFTDGGSEHRVLYIHRVKLTNLKPATSYGIYIYISTLCSGHWTFFVCMI